MLTVEEGAFSRLLQGGQDNDDSLEHSGFLPRDSLEFGTLEADQDADDFVPYATPYIPDTNHV